MCLHIPLDIPDLQRGDMVAQSRSCSLNKREPYIIKSRVATYLVLEIGNDIANHEGQR